MKKRKPPVLLLTSLVIMGAILFVVFKPFSPEGQIQTADSTPPASSNVPTTAAPRTGESASDIHSSLTSPGANVASSADGGDLSVPTQRAAQMKPPKAVKIDDTKPDPNRISSFGLTGK